MSGDAYFGLGQATFKKDSGPASWEATELRFELERAGVRLPKGFHAKDDREDTRVKVFDLISKHAPRIDVTLLHKKYLPQEIKEDVEKDHLQLYYRAWQKHSSYQARYVLKPYDRVFVVAASIFEHRRKQQAARAAIESVVRKFARSFEWTLCTWDNPTAWGLQVADYVLWAVQRDLVYGSCKHFKAISPLIETVYSPWEKDGSRLEYKPAVDCRRRGRPLGTLIFNRNYPRLRKESNFEHSPGLGYAQEENIFDDRDDGYRDIPELDDPQGALLMGKVPWSDDEPWIEEGDWTGVEYAEDL